MNTLSTPIDGSNRWNVLAGNLPAPDGLQLDASLSRFVTTKANALIIGEGAPVIRVLNVVWPTLRKPVVHCEGRRLILPVGREGTLVIGDAHRLADEDQQRLLEWWDAGGPHPRIIACASPQLFTFVAEGAFSQCLFDRFRDVQLVLT